MLRSGVFALHATIAVLYAAVMQTNGDKYATKRPDHRYTVPEAAEALGVTVDAIRSRIKRHTITHVREDGRVYVLLSGDQGVTSHDQGDDQGDDHRADQPPQTGPDHRDELLEELRDRVRALEDANRENRRIIAGLIERTPVLPAASHEEPPDARKNAAEGEPGTNTSPVSTSPQTGARRRPWWRRVFGFDR